MRFYLYHGCNKLHGQIMPQWLGKKDEIDLIHFLTRFGYATRTSPCCKLHGTYIHYTKVKNVLYVNECQDKEWITLVTLLLTMLFNACFTYQKSKASNMLVDALNTFNLNTTLDNDTFMNTLSKYMSSYKFFNFGIFCIISCSCHLSCELLHRLVVLLYIQCWMCSYNIDC
jgi:hypothetical protein